MATASLSFTLRPVSTYDDLQRACTVRADGYGRQIPAYRDVMLVPDAIDQSPWTQVFLCEDKRTAKPIGTMRVQTNTRGGVQLEIEKYVTPPTEILDSGRAEMSRLVALPGVDPVVKLALWKAGYLHCLASQVRWLLIGARKPGLVRQYEELGAKDVYGNGRMIPLGHGGNLPHRILALDVVSAERHWHAANHRMLSFMVHTLHPDIEVFSVQRQESPRLRVVA